MPSAGRRTQRRYRLSPAGDTAHARWLRQPIDPTTVASDVGTHVMRFVMAEGVLGPDEILSLLDGLGSALEAFIAATTDYLETTPMPGRHPQLALRHGIGVHRASLGWVRSAIETLRVAQHSTAQDVAG